VKIQGYDVPGALIALLAGVVAVGAGFGGTKNARARTQRWAGRGRAWGGRQRDRVRAWRGRRRGR